MEGVRLVPLVLFVGFFAALFYAYYQAMKKIKQRENTLEPLVPLFGNSRNLICTNPTTDIWSISGNRQNSNDFSWPTHDAHVSIDSFVITSDTLNAAKTSVPPPPYSELGLPTYEEATKGVPPQEISPPSTIIYSNERTSRAS